jgi:hypothetical protein
MRRPCTATISVSVRRRDRGSLGRNSNSICLGHHTRCKTALCRRVQGAHATGQVSVQDLFIFYPKTRVFRVCFISLFLRFFTNNSGWTLPALFATLRDLRDLAFDVSLFFVVKHRVNLSAGGRASTGRESEE